MKNVIKNIIGWLLLIGLLVIAYYFFKTQIFLFISSNPTTARIYSEIVGNTPLGLFYISILSALFFIMIPTEAIFVYYLFLGMNPLIVTLIVLLGNAIGLTIDYAIGFLIGRRFVKRSLKEKFERWHDRTLKWGWAIVVVGNIIPSPIEIMTLFLGGVRYPYMKLLKYTLLGRAAKFVLLAVAYYYFAASLLPYVSAYFPG